VPWRGGLCGTPRAAAAAQSPRPNSHKGFAEHRARIQRVAVVLAAGETSVLNVIAVAQRSYLNAPPVAS
jgi:hypothetical protein